MESEIQLRSKKELIERFIEENLPRIKDSDTIPEVFEGFWTLEKQKALETLGKDENLDQEKLHRLVSSYIFTEKEPLRDEVIDSLNTRPGLRDRKKVSERIVDRIRGFVETFINGMG